MKITINVQTDYHVDPFTGVEHEATNSNFEFPFELHEKIYKISYIHRKYSVVKYTLQSIGYSGLYFYRTTNGDYIYSNDSNVFEFCYTNLDEAIKKCLELNEKAKIKVIDKSSQLY